MLILVLGSTGLILVGGFFESLTDRLREAYIYSQTGHLQVNRRGYSEKGLIDPFKYLIADSEKISEALEGKSHVRYTVPRLNFAGMLSTDKNSLSVIAVGVDPLKESRMSQTPYRDLFPAAGNLFGEDLDSKDPYGILVGEELRSALGLEIGDSVSFIVNRPEGAIDGADFHIRGIYTAGIKEVGERVIKMPMGTAQTLLGTPNQVHSLLVILDSTPLTYPVMDQLEEMMESEKWDLEIIPWADSGVLYKQSVSFLDRIYFVVQIIISIIFFFSIANTINMALFERMREYGTMMALGNERWVIFGMIFLEACMLGFLGGILGIILGAGVGHIVSSFGILMPPPPVSSGTIGGLLVLILLTPKILVGTFLISFFATVLSSIIPGYRGSHFPITHALGYV